MRLANWISMLYQEAAHIEKYRMCIVNNNGNLTQLGKNQNFFFTISVATLLDLVSNSYASRIKKNIEINTLSATEVQKNLQCFK